MFARLDSTAASAEAHLNGSELIGDQFESRTLAGEFFRTVPWLRRLPSTLQPGKTSLSRPHDEAEAVTRSCYVRMDPLWRVAWYGLGLIENKREHAPSIQTLKTAGPRTEQGETPVFLWGKACCSGDQPAPSRMAQSNFESARTR